MEQYNVTGMSCAACSARVEKAVSSVPGVFSVSVSLLTNSMGVEGTASAQDIMQAVEKAGYGASLKGQKKQDLGGDELKDTETPVLKKRLFISLGFLVVLMYISMGHKMWNWPLPVALADNMLALALTEMLLTIIIMVINQRFFISGFKGLLHRSPNMDTLVALGAGAAFVYSTYDLFAMTYAVLGQNMALAHHYMHDLYFESAGTILTLITLGKTLEAYSKGKTKDALRGLMALSPQEATLLKDGKEVTVPIEQVQKEDVFVVHPGENIPVDGVILTGHASINEASLTGESIPVDKKEGDLVSAATINQDGYITCKARRVGEDTTLSQIIRLVSDAAATKAPIAKVADKVSGIFVPCVIGIALVSLLIWLLAGESAGFALARAISVLVISCPCALGLATPVAIMVGNGKGARNGILFKNAVSLEETGKAEIIVLDKTGTITKGEPAVTDVIPAEGVTEEELFETALALESHSEHPLAKAILAYGVSEQYDINGVSRQKRQDSSLQRENAAHGSGIHDILEIEDFRAAAGNGLTGMLGGEPAAGGKAEFIQEMCRIPEKVKEKAEQLAEEGKTPLYFMKKEKVLGCIAVADVLKEESPEAIAELKDMGMEVVMLTGDHEKTAQAIGRKAGVSQVIANVLPQEKEQAVRELKERGKVIMVGDGINDAPALTRADIGIAIGAGTDVAMEAADVVLMKSNLKDIPAAIRLSRATLRNIRENLFWAFFYNTIGIPLAAGVWIPVFGWQLNPMFGAAAMGLSSFCVVSNALRLNLADIRSTKRDASYKKRAERRKKNEGDSGNAKYAENIKGIENISLNNKIYTEKETKKMEKKMKIEGMMCGHCEAAVKKALEAVDGVESAAVSHEKGEAIVSLSKDVANEILKTAVEEKEYTVTDIQ